MRDTDVDSIMIEYDVSLSMVCEIPLSASIVYVPWTVFSIRFVNEKIKFLKPFAVISYHPVLG